MTDDPFMAPIYKQLEKRPYGKHLVKLLSRPLPPDWQYRFELTETHIKLLRRLVVYFRYDSHLGAPAVSTNRPYGNSAILSDIAEIVGLKQPDWEAGEDWTEEQIDQLLKWHYEATRALEVFLAAGAIKPGTYVRCDFGEWEPEDNLTKRGICPKCFEAFLVHNDDGSCVKDYEGDL